MYIYVLLFFIIVREKIQNCELKGCNCLFNFNFVLENKRKTELRDINS